MLAFQKVIRLKDWSEIEMNWFNIIKTRSNANTGGGSKRGGSKKENRKNQDALGRERIPIVGLGADAQGYGRAKTKTAGRKEEEDLILRPEIENEKIKNEKR